MNFTDLTEREKAILAKFRTLTDEQQDEYIRYLKTLLTAKEDEPQ